MRTTEPSELAGGLWRLGTELVNWYLVEDGGRLSRGPQLMPHAFNLSSATCLDSLTKLQDVDGGVLAFGHGEPSRDGADVDPNRCAAPCEDRTSPRKGASEWQPSWR